MNIYRQAYFYIRVLADIIVLLFCFQLAYIIIPSSVVFRADTNIYFSLIAVFASWLIASAKNGIYDEFRSKNFSYELIAIIKNCFFMMIGVSLAILLLKENEFPRRFLVVYSFTSFLFLSAEKYLIREFIHFLRSKGRNLKTMMIIGAGAVGRRFFDEITTNPHFGYRFVGFLDDKLKKDLNGEYLGPISNLESVLESRIVDNVMIALPNHAFSKINDIVKTCERYPTHVRLIPDYFQCISNRYSVTMFGNLPVISVREEKINELHWRLVKRGFDTAFALLVFIFILSWLFPLIALFSKLDSKGPILFKQERWGRNNRKFYIYKFRSMITASSDLDENGKYNQATRNDPRITKLGKFLRSSNFDELPQFWNILKGELSLVGPRPHPSPLNQESKEKIDKYMRRHLVKPGLTGWAQVHGMRGETKGKSLMQRRVEYDLWYIENWSFWLDLQIILMTIWVMIKGDKNAY
ncbi:MAG: undecaprenyl-phosphate glucose phosphotransferase [Ignavibacteriae bacterium HGW-Ignavibacteriae-3]|nr:MAG: undecaprenyl-phosphate glucose phosphotransferase [Ignavibacteriae bacterium HGW-Ignavibacteriae-3]